MAYSEIELMDIARGAIESNLGNVFEADEEPSMDSIYDEAYTLAFDALADKGVEHAKARRVAAAVAQDLAQD
jgi:hypothetical protein